MAGSRALVVYRPPRPPAHPLILDPPLPPPPRQAPGRGFALFGTAVLAGALLLYASRPGLEPPRAFEEVAERAADAQPVVRKPESNARAEDRPRSTAKPLDRISADVSPPAAEPAPPAPIATARPEPPPTARQVPEPAKAPVRQAAIQPHLGTPPQAAPDSRDRQSRIGACARVKSTGATVVCLDPFLTSFDRTASAEYQKALSTAPPAVRSALAESHNRFVKSRDQCQTRACATAVYVNRMREIREIAAGAAPR